MATKEWSLTPRPGTIVEKAGATPRGKALTQILAAFLDGIGTGVPSVGSKLRQAVAVFTDVDRPSLRTQWRASYGQR